jgi:hypothetical protein
MVYSNFNINSITVILLYIYNNIKVNYVYRKEYGGYAVGQMVEELYYKPEGSGFDFPKGHAIPSIYLILPAALCLRDIFAEVETSPLVLRPFDGLL